MDLFCELFEGLHTFFERFKHRNCLHLEAYKHKIARIEHELRETGEKIVKLRQKLNKRHHHNSDSDSESDEIEAKLHQLRKLSHHLEKLTLKLFRTIDEFFEVNAHVQDSDFCAYRKAYEKLKWQLVRVLKELKEACSSAPRRPNKEDDDGTSDESSEEEESSSSSSSSSDESSEEWEKKIDNKKNFKRVVKYMLKNIEDYYRKCVERRQREINRIKKDIIRIKFELVKLLKKVSTIFKNELFYFRDLFFNFFVYNRSSSRATIEIVATRRATS